MSHCPFFLSASNANTTERLSVFRFGGYPTSYQTPALLDSIPGLGRPLPLHARRAIFSAALERHDVIDEVTGARSGGGPRSKGQGFPAGMPVLLWNCAGYARGCRAGMGKLRRFSKVTT